MPVVGFIAGLGLPELLVVLVLVLILFGAGRLPQVFESFGKGIRAFRDASKDESPIELDDQKQISKSSDASISEAQEVKSESAS
ncbi:MAG: twin-arginine translocase TatA/TatE family subunit [Acidobacteriota bacterium]